MAEKVGRPLKFQSADELEKLVDNYFTYCIEQDEIPDVEGLAYYLDTTRKTILDYEDKEEYSYTIKRAKNRIFHHKKQAAFKGKIHPTVFIFDAKNNHDYRDKTEVESNVTMEYKINDPFKD